MALGHTLSSKCGLREKTHAPAFFVERLCGYQARSTQEKLRVAEALEELPLITRALSNGELNWSAARELTRVALSENECEWLTFASGKTVR